MAVSPVQLVVYLSFNYVNHEYDTRAYYIISLFIILTASTLFAQWPDAHLCVVDNNKSTHTIPPKYAPRNNPWTDPFLQKMRLEMAYSRAFSEQTEPLPQQVSSDLLLHDFYDNFDPISWQEWASQWNRSTEAYWQRWNDFVNAQKLTGIELQRHERAEMRRWNQYKYPGFRNYLQSLSVYQEYISEIAAQLNDDPVFSRKLHGLLCCEPILHIKREAERIIQVRRDRHAKTERDTMQEQVAGRQRMQEELFRQQSQTRHVYDTQASEVDTQEREWHELLDIHNIYQCGESTHLTERIHALSTMRNAGVLYTQSAYELPDDVSRLLEKHNCVKNPYTPEFDLTKRSYSPCCCIDGLWSA